MIRRCSVYLKTKNRQGCRAGILACFMFITLSQEFLFVNTKYTINFMADETGAAGMPVCPGTSAARSLRAGRCSGMVFRGRLWMRGKSNRPDGSSDGHRSDSTGMPDAFPSQRFSGSGREALRLSRPKSRPGAKIFSRIHRCPRNTMLLHRPARRLHAAGDPGQTGMPAAPVSGRWDGRMKAFVIDRRRLK